MGASVLKEHKCPHCGASVTFDSNVQMMKCPYCSSEFATDVFDTELPEENMAWESENAAEFSDGDNVCAYVCNSCGGEIIADINTAATACPYCDSTVVMTGKVSGVLKPDLIIPFKLDKKAATDGFKKHLLGKKLLPRVFKDEAHIEECRGIYVPFWLFDADVDASVVYDTTRVRSWSTPNHIYTETSHYDVFRGGTLAFSAVPVDGSSKMPDDLMESLEPYDKREETEFSTAYLSGYYADKYDVSKDTSSERAGTRIKRSTEDSFKSTVIGYSSVNTKNSSVRFSKSSARYALYPVWLLNTVWRGERYTFAMNGQTGKFVGNLPCDKSLAAKYFFGILGGVFALAAAIAVAVWFM